MRQELEERYTVIKNEDIEHITGPQKQQLREILNCIQRSRVQRGKAALTRYVVVAEDWPMYRSTVDSVLLFAELEQQLSEPLQVSDKQLTDWLDRIEFVREGADRCNLQPVLDNIRAALKGGSDG